MHLRMFQWIWILRAYPQTDAISLTMDEHMNLRKSALRALAIGVLGLSVVGMPHAAELKENTADIRQDITIPGMAVTIKRPGNETGCNTANHEKWDIDKGGCSNTEYMRENAQVVSIASDEPRLSIGVIESTNLTANVRTKDGQPVGAGVPVTWSTSKGNLSSYSSITNAASQAIVALNTPKGTEKGLITISATAKGGGASTLVVVANSATIADLSAAPASTLANGTSFITLVATLTYENGMSVGAGESLSWDTGIGKYTYAETVTNGSGKASAYLVSSVPGTNFAKAIKDVSKLATVTFTAPEPEAPVIESFTMVGRSKNWGATRYKYFEPDRVFWVGWVYEPTVFTWVVQGADRYELYDPFGMLKYSGTENSVDIGNTTIDDKGRIAISEIILTKPFVLKAFKGNKVAVKEVQATQAFDTTDYITN